MATRSERRQSQSKHPQSAGLTSRRGRSLGVPSSSVRQLEYPGSTYVRNADDAGSVISSQSHPSTSFYRPR